MAIWQEFCQTDMDKNKGKKTVNFMRQFSLTHFIRSIIKSREILCAKH